MFIALGFFLLVTVLALLEFALRARDRRRMASLVGLPRLPAEASCRLLVPIANPETAASLLQLAIGLQAAGDTIYPATVVKPGGRDIEARVAAAELVLTEASLPANAYGIQTLPATRVSADVPAALAMAALETRASRMILGWNGQRSLEQRLFGGIIDRVLGASPVEILVTRLSEELRSYGRLVLVLPAGVDRHGGFAGALQTVRRLAFSLDLSVAGVIVGDNPALALQGISETDATLLSSCHAVPTWRAAWTLLDTGTKRDDLVVALSVRRGTTEWQPILERLPGKLAGRADRSFIVLYPAEPAGQLLAPSHAEIRYLAFPIEGSSPKEAVRALFSRSCEAVGFEPRHDRQGVPSSVTVSQNQAIVDLTIPDWPEPTVAVAVFRNEIRDPRSGRPIGQVRLHITPA